MANNKTDYLEGKIIEHVLRNVSFTSPATVYIALFTADPTETGSQAAEVSGGSYARTSATFGAHSGGSVNNSADVTFPQASGSWGTITHLGIMDASTAGNMLYFGALTSSVTIASGEQLRFPSGSIVVAEL